MATKSKQQKLEEEPTLFLQSDVILEVESKQLHVRKQVLAENSPVFKRMFESNFKERRDVKISLPGKKYKDFEMFLRTFYHPAIVCPITKDTILSILPLAEEYQVLKVKARCENCMIQALQLTSKGVPQIDTRTLLHYASYAEFYNLSSALPVAVQMCAKYDDQLLKQAGIEDLISERMMMKILQERNKLLQNLAILKLQKGDDTMVLETLHLLSGLMEKDRVAMLKEYENRLVIACNQRKVTPNSIVECIVAAEQFDLKNLLSTAIKAARSHPSAVQSSGRFHEISDKSKFKIYDTQGSYY